MIEDRDLLTITAEEQLHTDSVRFILRSRFFDWSGAISFASFEGPDPEMAMRLCRQALFPLFRAFGAIPFGRGLVRQLLAATMDRLMPALQARLREAAQERRRRPPRHFYDDYPTFEAALPRAPVTGVVPSHTHGRGLIEAPPPPPNHFFDLPAPQPFPAHDGRLVAFTQESIERSRKTLLHCLSPSQRYEFLQHNNFIVIAQNGRPFRVLPTENYNVEDGDYRYCCLPAQPLPIFDKMLAAKIWLEADFDNFMHTANRNPLHARAAQAYLDEQNAGAIIRVRDLGNL